MDFWFDSRDRIVQVDDDWYPFALANGAPELLPSAVSGKHLAEFIADHATVSLWEILLAKARAGTVIHNIAIRCDSPTLRRTLCLQVEQERANVRVSSLLVREEPRGYIALFSADRAVQGDPIVACSWCRKFEATASTWVEVESFLSMTGLFEQPVLPPVTHGICPGCFESVSKECGADGGA